MIDWKNVLLQLGYKFTGTCNCSGHYTLKFKMKPYSINIRTGQGKFRIQKYGVSVNNWMPLDQLPVQLKAIHTNVAV